MQYKHIILRAVLSEKNINRIYEIFLSKGLFKKWLVITAHGRYGENLSQMVHSFDTYSEAEKFMNKTLKKRLNAEKRIGTNYKIIQAE